MTDPLDDSRNPNHGRSGGLLPRQPIVERLRHGANGLWSENLMHVPNAMLEAADRIEELEAALRGMTNAADGLSFAADGIRSVVGNTNWSVLRHWVAEARAVLPPITDLARAATERGK